MILGEGDEARKKAEEKNGNKSKTKYLKLGDGGSMRGYLLTGNFVAYMNHNDYEKGIRSHPCTDPKHGKNCISCKAGVKRAKKVLVPFWDADKKEIVVWDAAASKASVAYGFIDTYGDDAFATPIVFTRTGKDTGTTYTLMPLPPKAAKEVGAPPEDVVIDRAFWEAVMAAPDEDYVRELIGAAKADADEAVDISAADAGDGTKLF
jgi:hypothetical protein